MATGSRNSDKVAGEMALNPARSIETKRSDLAAALTSVLRGTAFENKYPLHPRRLEALGDDVVEDFLSFLSARDAQRPAAVGRSLAQVGVGEKTLLEITSCLRRFSLAAVGDDPAARAALELVESFTTGVVEGFIRVREEQILSDQEQLRRALSHALQSQGLELHVKNHAINTALDGIMLADLEGRVTYVNPSFLTLWGFTSPDEVVGAHISDFWVGEEARNVLDILTRTGGWRGELSVRPRDRRSLSVELSASLISNEQGQAIGIMTSFMDITERKRLQTQVLQAQKMDALGLLAGGIAHDFNNLLTAISANLQLLLLDAPKETDMYHDLMQIMSTVERGTALTRQLRFFTRQATGTRQIISLNDVVQETWEIFKHTFPPEITIQLSLAPSPWTIEADPNQMSQVLVNLCMNARDAMTDAPAGPDGRTITIETANIELKDEDAARSVGARPGRYMRLTVRDTGVGMSPELLERLFIPFVTTKGERSGTGLGLAVVYGIVASHQGFIDVQSEVGKGSTFEVFLPMTERREAPIEDLPAPTLVHGQGTILVVDDEPQVREVISRVLASCGYTVITAEDGREALRRFGDGSAIDLVVLDMVMPGMGGRECLARLREADAAVRVLIATGYTSDGSAQELLGEGALAIVEKPLDISSFAGIVQTILGKGGVSLS
ncbi:MAG TPA: response regulator [Spirochaetia bacterium]|nr:response regulator [Spirochaetia bacterium]